MTWHFKEIKLAQFLYYPTEFGEYSFTSGNLLVLQIFWTSYITSFLYVRCKSLFSSRRALRVPSYTQYPCVWTHAEGDIPAWTFARRQKLQDSNWKPSARTMYRVNHTDLGLTGWFFFFLNLAFINGLYGIFPMVLKASIWQECAKSQSFTRATVIY